MHVQLNFNGFFGIFLVGVFFSLLLLFSTLLNLASIAIL